MPLAASCKKIIVLFCFTLTAFTVGAQGLAQITGKVLDGETGQPVPFANIYFNSTSIGTVADSAGNFALKNVPIHFTELVFSSIGYESFVYRVSLAPGKIVTMAAKLKPSKKTLHEIVVKGKRDKLWKENYDRFIKEFIGTGPNASQCEIVNPEVLNFTSFYDVLKATANQPLELVNRALGYKIVVTLVLFDLSSEHYRIVVYTRFQSLIPKNEREEFRWQVNRSRTYKGSERHFIKSLIDKRSESEGFRVYEKITAKFRNGSQVVVKPTMEVSQDLLFPQLPTDGKLEGYYKLLKKGVFEIHYLNKFTPKSKRVYVDFPHPVSWLEVSDDYLLSPFTGIIRSNASAMVSGEMGKNRLADILPEDYDPVPDEGKIYLAKHAVEFGTIQGVAVDSASGKPLANAFVFINNSLYKANTDYKGQFELKNIPRGTYSLVGTYGSYCAESQKIDVRGDSISTANFRLPIRKFERWDEPLTYGGNSTEDLKRMYFAQHFWNWHDFSTYALNLSAMEIKFLENGVQMRTNSPLEIVDHKTGYKIRYFLKTSEIPVSRKGQTTIRGFVSFDTLSAKSFKERKNWLENRDDYYLGTAGHFIRSLAEGRSQEESFEIYTLPPKTKGRPKKRNRQGPESIPGDSLLTRGKFNNFGLTLPENTFVRFDGGKATKIMGDHLSVSSQGFLSDQSKLKLQGPMKTKAIPIVPMEYVPSTEAISDPKVWVFIKENELNSLQQMVEKPFLHTDKDYYYPGEKIWYKAYLRYAFRQLRDSLSKVLHVELINPDKKVIRNEILKIDRGVTWGDITLPDTLKQGTYFLRAYTRWTMNFGSDYIFIKPIPVLSTEQNLAYEEIRIKTGSPHAVLITADKSIYKPREKIVLRIKRTDSTDEPVRSDLSVSVTDADKVIRGKWGKSIAEDSLPKKETWKYKRVSYPMEKEFSYDCYVKKEFSASPFSVLISAVTGGQSAFALPTKDSRFKFRADFFDTASFIFRANVKSGRFAGHVFIEKPATLPIPLSLVAPDFSLRDDDAKYRIKYAYDPNEKTTMLEEVVIRGSRIIEPPKKTYLNSIMMTADKVYEGKDLTSVAQSAAQDPRSFWLLMVDKMAGARPDADHLILIRRLAASFKVNNVPYGVDDMLFLNPADIERIEVYYLLALINVYLKSGPDAIDDPKEFDKYTLSGYSLPSKFYMRDYSKSSPDNELPDFRTTIYWNPNLVIDGDESTLSFFAADLPARYRIVVEGLSDKGQPIYGEQIIEIRE